LLVAFQFFFAGSKLLLEVAHRFVTAIDLLEKQVADASSY